MEVEVDHDLCDGYAFCEDIVPGVFEVRADDLSHVIDAHPPRRLHAAVWEAADTCPKRAIRVTDGTPDVA